MKNLFYTSPKYLQNLKGLDSSASEIDAVANVIDIKLAKIHQKIRQAANGIKDVVFIRTGDSTRSILRSEFQIYDKMLFTQLGLTYFNNAAPSQTATGWLNGTAVNTISQAIEAAKGADGENTILEFSMGLNDFTSLGTKALAKSAVKSAIQAFLASKPKALVFMTAPHHTSPTERETALIEIYDEVSEELGLYLVNPQIVTSSLDFNSTDYYLDSTHLNQYGMLRINFYILNKMFPVDIIRNIEFGEYILPPNTDNLALTSSVKAGLYTAGGLFNPNASFRYIDINIAPNETDLRMNSVHSGNRAEVYFFNGLNEYTGMVFASTYDSGRYFYVPSGTAKIIVNISTSGTTWDSLGEQVVVKYHENPVHINYNTLVSGFKSNITHTRFRNGSLIDDYGRLGTVGKSLKIDVSGKMKWSV